MTDITLATKHTIVSMLARGRRVQDVADRTTLPLATVQSIGREYGAPDLGRLATCADELRKMLDRETTHPSAGSSAADSVDLLKAEAEKYGATQLVTRALRITSMLDQLRADLKAVRAEHQTKAAIAAERQVKLDKLAELKAQEDALKAEQAKLREELKPGRTVVSKGTYKEQQANRARSAAVREWAIASGMDVPARGRIPQTILDAHAAAVK